MAVEQGGVRRDDQCSRLPDRDLADIRNHWIAVGLSTAPADRPRADAGVRLAYRRAGLFEHIRIVWAASPISGALIAESLVRRANRPRVVASVVQPLTRAARIATNRVAADVTRQVLHAVTEPVAARVAAAAWKPISDQVARETSRLAIAPAYGQHDAPWLATVQALALSGAEFADIQPFAELAQSCGWWWPFDDVCVVSERHSTLATDECGHLHSTDGPAVTYPDGWSIYAWHGAIVDASVVLNPERITLAQIRREGDPDVRDALIDRYGFERYVKDSGEAPSRPLTIERRRRTDVGRPTSAPRETSPVESHRVSPILSRQYRHHVGV